LDGKELADFNTMPAREPHQSLAQADFVAFGIAAAAVLMFAGTGSAVLPQIARAFNGYGTGPDLALTNALLLNIALVIFGWQRHRMLLEEIAERRKAEEQAWTLAETDPLTGCLNRRSIGQATDRLVAAARTRGEEVAFLMFDLDNFKRVNDVYGHKAGDEILREIAGRIIRAMPKGSLVARLGGDEFACVTPFDPNRVQLIDQLAESLITVAARPVKIDGTELETTVSIGITRTSSDSSSEPAQTLLHMADIAMYHAKKQGRNRHFWFEESMETELRFRSELEVGIRQGIPLGEFVPYYEQQIDIETGKLLGFEMLARWHSPTTSEIGPDIFIPIAEEIGLISELSEGVIARALLDARRWDPRLTLSINISPIQLRDPWFAQKLLKMLVEANFPPSRLEVEITESCLHENHAEVRSLIASLKNQGISISLDDFGTGYSSLAQLRSLPFDRIKIDRSFVSSLADGGDSTAIMQAITSLGEGLRLPITAEGIDSQEVLDRLQRIGTFKGQGYLYGFPESGHETDERLSQLGLLLTGSDPAAPATAEPVIDGTDRLPPLDATRRSA
jgi:diguanylate cyclase (GGDEF)-like protein